LKEEVVIEVIKGIRKRAGGMQIVASFFFGSSIGILLGAGYLFFIIGTFDQVVSPIQIAFSLFSRLILITFAFYIVRIMMSVVTYNLGVSNDLYAKADSLALYKVAGSISLAELKEHLEVNHHKFEASKGFSGKDELDNILKIIKAVESKPNKPSNTDGDKAAAGS
jgi:predicted membrane protein